MRPRAALDPLHPYEPGKPAAEVRRELGLERVVKLASNEGPYGPFPAALQAISRASAELNRYPELGGLLRERLADRHGVEPGRVALGSGADGIVNLLALAFLEPGDEVVMGWPSFVSYRLAALKMGATPVTAALRDGSYDADALLGGVGEATRILYVCNPNNPTGGMMTRADLARLLDAVPDDVLVVVDEAYHEYVTEADYPDAASEHGDRPNVCVLRTFSKIYGLAGLRIGYAVAPEGVVDALGRARNAFDTTELAHVAALASLDDRVEVARRRSENERGREQLRQGVARLGLVALPSVANFLCLEVGDGRALAAALEAEGVIVRPLEPFGDPRSIRVTVGTSEENAVFLAAIERCLQVA
jgi:histidinol-phosphate aminotransferase